MTKKRKPRTAAQRDKQNKARKVQRHTDNDLGLADADKWIRAPWGVSYDLAHPP